MIRYQLVCDRNHEFEAWFRSAADYDAQAADSAVACPSCGSTHVGKALMAPAVSTARSRENRIALPPIAESLAPVPVSGGAPIPASAPAIATPAAPDPAPSTCAGGDAAAKAFIEAMQEVGRHVRANSEYVGPRFAEEARRIHYNEAEPRGIYGEATPEDARALTEEGIPVHPLPVLPEERN